MVALTDGKDSSFSVDNTNTPPRKLKILMLHGYTQSGKLLHAKTRGIEKLLHRYFPAEINAHNGSFPGYPGGVQLIYPTGPFRLTTTNIPGFSAKRLDADEENELWGWWTRDMDSDLFAGLEQGLASIARVIRENGGIDAIMGFSQGAAAAAFVASLLEPGREQAFADVRKKNPSAMHFPEDWRDLSTLCPNGLKFAVIFSGFLPMHPSYRAFFKPRIQAPTLHIIGTLDSVIDEFRSIALAERCVSKGKKLVYHQGGHIVPNSRLIKGVLTSFIRDCLIGRSSEKGVEKLRLP
ncbi:unnamed protein product [Blumeria hordei]|uniref:Serine hydrolase domain-containing protein n=2 Tax=Blumeria hordei TaxID=2867405 RepID=A0A383UVF8_BLUHO|nr:dihydrofolate reductase [Blumeria hordei DH14]SZF04333.1 unnamed protein product [Blumeria hordei]